MKPNQYDTTAVLRLVMFRLAKGEKVDLRKELAAGTAIPEARLDFAVSEIQQIVFGLKQLARFFAMIADDDDKLRDMIDSTVADGCIWTDDDKRDLRVRVYADEDTEGEPLVTVATKLKGDADADA